MFTEEQKNLLIYLSVPKDQWQYYYFSPENSLWPPLIDYWHGNKMLKTGEESYKAFITQQNNNAGTTTS
jgi:hypothetical protein